MNRTAQRKIKTDNPDAGRAELRRIRKGIMENSHSGLGHGKRTYRPVADPETKKAERDIRVAKRSIVKRIGDIWHALGIETHADEEE